MKWIWYSWSKQRKDAEYQAKRAKERYLLKDKHIKIVKEKGGYTVYILPFATD